MDQRIERPARATPNPELALDLGGSKRKSSRRRRWTITLAILALLGAAWLGYSVLQTETPAVAYRTQAVQKGSLTVQVSATGT